ncbi:conserved hypothetical protein [Nitrosotalea sinensis]|uniref:Uncharacterized protein n=1 Tax=Nitrosotalea sinensis TaxID=1499975 RepID=A0A2H1EID3_9ARCH|nr:hypothetical protein [Candidatus Nitrosotalea sinensis]SHO47074.1 conserved hypothetical protein [Candidatus Nitrosotalea sinensis]
MVSFDKDKLAEQIESLKKLPQIKEVKALRQRLEKELGRFEEKKIIRVKPIVQSANLSRSSKLKKYHRYLRMIRDNFPNLKYSDIRKQFSERRKGQESDIPDVIWQNPSP